MKATIPPLSFGRMPREHNAGWYWMPDMRLVQTTKRRKFGGARSPGPFPRISVGLLGLTEVWERFCGDPWPHLWNLVDAHPYVLALVVWYPIGRGRWCAVAYRVTDSAVLGFRTADGHEVWHDNPPLPGEPGGHPAHISPWLPPPPPGMS